VTPFSTQLWKIRLPFSPFLYYQKHQRNFTHNIGLDPNYIINITNETHHPRVLHYRGPLISIVPYEGTPYHVSSYRVADKAVETGRMNQFYVNSQNTFSALHSISPIERLVVQYFPLNMSFFLFNTIRQVPNCIGLLCCTTASGSVMYV